MKQFKTIFAYEFKGLVSNRSYKVTTIIFVAIILIGIMVPTFTGGISLGENTEVSKQFDDKATFAIVDKSDKFDETIFKSIFPKAKFKKVDSTKDLEKGVKKETYDAGFEIKENYDFTYYVKDSSVFDVKEGAITEALTQQKQAEAYKKAGIDPSVGFSISAESVNSKTITFGSDGFNGMFYTFGLIFVIYMIIIFYGQLTATSVASEKSNRTMELLVTSAKPFNLITGKVLASASAAFLQVGCVVAALAIGNAFFGKAWGGQLDMIFSIPMNVLIAFFLFGIFGYIFYCFLFGALGALVSKSEDVGTAITPVMMLFMIVFFVCYVGFMNPNSIIFIVASYLPFSSLMAMFARMAMVDVPLIEVIISFAILLASTALVAFAGSKIYRRATLMYGNRIKLTQALKWLSKKD